MSDLPTGWAWATVRELADPHPGGLTDGPFGSNLKTEHYVSEPGPRVIRLQNIGDGVFRGDDQAFISREHFELLKRHDARPGDVVIAALGDVLPRACLVPDAFGPAIVKADCFRLRPAPGINAHLIQHLLNSPQARNAAAHRISGVGRPRLNLGKVGDIRLPVPPAEEQERIVAAIEEQFSLVDAGVAALESVRQNLERMRAAVLLHVFATIADSSEVRAGREIFTFITSGSRGWARYYSTDGPAFIRIGNIPRSGTDLDLRDVQHVLPPANAEGTRTKVEVGDVLISITADLGRVAVVPPMLSQAYINQHVALARPAQGLEPRYIAWYLASPPGMKQWGSLRRGATKVGLGLDDIRAAQVPIPDPSQQRSAVARIEQAWTILDAIDRTVTDAARRADGLRASILATAFSGKLVSQNPADEPAPILLERVASERAASNGHGANMKRALRTKVTA